MTTEPTPTPRRPPTQLEPERFAEMATAIEQQVGTFIVGQQQLVRQTLISLLAGSHALLEGVPGLGKTMLGARCPRRSISASAASSSLRT